jgi:hypothetical protein
VNAQADLLGIEKTEAKVAQQSPETGISLQQQQRGSFIFCQKEGLEVFFFPYLCGQYLSAAD